VHAALPAVISVTERSAEPRFANLRGIMRAKKKPLDTWSLSDLGIDAGFATAGHSIIVDTSERPTRTAGRRIADEGSAGAEIVEFLAAAHLI
jgi:electron transfer flavoprotein beta subunit